MGTIEIIVLAFALAADAFSVAVSVGIVLTSANTDEPGSISGRQMFRLSWHFGLFQFLMPIVGWAAGRTIVDWIAPVDHWVALGLLCYVGGRMIRESFQPPEQRNTNRDPTRGMSLVVLSVATSIDALAVGLALAMSDVAIWVPCLVIGIVAGGMTIVGMTIGRRLGQLFSRRIETVGGIILIGIGVRIVLEHLSVI